MASITIDGSTIDFEQGVEYINDGTEEFDLGTLVIVNSRRREAYPDYADVIITLNSETIEACISNDVSTRTSQGTVPKYEHRIKLAEPVIKLSQYPHPDRIFNTIGGNKTQYLDHLREILRTAFYGKTSPLTIATATQTVLNVDADEKEYSGGDLFKTVVDMFRPINIVPTLSLTNEIGHKDIKQQGSEVSFSRIDAEIITSDIKDYAMKVYSKVKQATYEADLIAGGTYYPDKNTGVSVRSSSAKFDDVNAHFLLDSGIRRMIEVQGKNVVTSTQGTITNLQLIIVSKEEWDDLEIELDATILETGQYKNNTPYFVEGDNEIQNVGTQYDIFNKVGVQNDDAFSQAHRRALYVRYGSGEYVQQNIRDYETTFYYQISRDMDIVQERHDIDRVNKVSTIINQQKDSKLELARFGNANKSLINRLGNDTYQITVRYFDKNTPTYFQVGDYTSDGYRIIKRQFLIRESSQDVTYLLTKNQATLNPNTSVKRSFVSPFTISKRNILTNFVYEEYFEFSTTQRTDTTTDQNIRDIIFNALDYSASYDTPMYNCQFRRDSSIYINMSVGSIPMGQSFQFNVQFYNPKIAGYQLVSYVDGITTKYKMKPVSYGDDNGEVENGEFWFMNTSTINKDNHPQATFNTNWNLHIPYFNIGLNPDEILGMTYAKHCVTDNANLFIGDYFLQNNSLIKELGVAPSVTLVYYDDNPRYTTDDKYGKTGWNGTATYVVDSPNKEYISFAGVPSGKSWALIETASPYRLYMAYNNTGTDIDRVYLNLLTERTNTETL